MRRNAVARIGILTLAAFTFTSGLALTQVDTIDVHFADPTHNAGDVSTEAETTVAGTWTRVQLHLPVSCSPSRIEWDGNYSRLASSSSPGTFYVMFSNDLKPFYTGEVFGHVGVAPRGPGCSESGFIDTWISVRLTIQVSPPPSQ